MARKMARKPRVDFAAAQRFLEEECTPIVEKYLTEWTARHPGWSAYCLDPIENTRIALTIVVKISAQEMDRRAPRLKSTNNFRFTPELLDWVAQEIGPLGTLHNNLRLRRSYPHEIEATRENTEIEYQLRIRDWKQFQLRA